MKPNRILYLVPHRYDRSPGQRFRCEHFIPHLKEAGYQITYSNALSEWDDHYFYKRGKYFIKLFIALKVFFKRLFLILRVRKYSVVFIYREAYMLGTIILERLVKFLKVPVIFDFDDSIWLNDTSQGNANLQWMKRPAKTADICKLADRVIVGNEYLADYAKQYNKNVFTIPTTIDINYHQAQETLRNIDKKHITVGWTGSNSTLKYLRVLENVLITLKEKYGDKIRYMIIADIPPTTANPKLLLEFFKWDKEHEIAQLSEIDIGIMPLSDDKWTRGKCGFKGLQYMSLSIPTVMSPVGVNTTIIQHGENGLLASTEQEWTDCISLLIENKQIRTQLGSKGRKTVEKYYSVETYKKEYISLFKF